MRQYRYSGAGNCFVAIDIRNIDAARFRSPGYVRPLCAVNGTDGMILLGNSRTEDFRMEFFNPDGSGGMMCGNGGRCAAAFADLLGIKPASEDGYYSFEAPDAVHRAKVLSRNGEFKQVRLSMGDVPPCVEYPEGLFLNTGTRHLVVFVGDADAVDVAAEGSRLRNLERFAPEGTNVNFVSLMGDGRLRVRTFEKGVEGETLSCGTGSVASAIASALRGLGPEGGSRTVLASTGDELAIEFRALPDGSFDSVYLSGPTLCEGEL